VLDAEGERGEEAGDEQGDRGDGVAQGAAVDDREHKGCEKEEVVGEAVEHDPEDGVDAAVGHVGVAKEGDDFGEVKGGDVADGDDVGEAGEDEDEELGAPETAELAVPEGEKEFGAERDEGVLGLDAGAEAGHEAERYAFGEGQGRIELEDGGEEVGQEQQKEDVLALGEVDIAHEGLGDEEEDEGGDRCGAAPQDAGGAQDSNTPGGSYDEEQRNARVKDEQRL